MSSAAWWPLRRAVEAVQSGGVIAYPTEAVYGLGCDPLEHAAVGRILAIKERDAAKGLILIAAEFRQLLPYLAPLTPAVKKKVEASWPGPVTWVLPAAEHVPFWLSGGRETLAVRVTAHPLARTLCEACDMALVSTSANHGGHPPARSDLQVRARFGEEVDYIVPGSVGPHTRPTEIRDGITDRVLRAG
jgi:L-threonylcarbamoyladenylate synthase